MFREIVLIWYDAIMYLQNWSQYLKSKFSLWIQIIKCAPFYSSYHVKEHARQCYKIAYLVGIAWLCMLILIAVILLWYYNNSLIQISNITFIFLYKPLSLVFSTPSCFLGCCGAYMLVRMLVGSWRHCHSLGHSHPQPMAGHVAKKCCHVCIMIRCTQPGSR